MTVIIDDSDTWDFAWSDDVTGGNWFAARDVARERVDLLRVLLHYAKRQPTALDDGAGFKLACFLPSRVSGYSGTCAEQDAATGHPGEHLSVTRATDGTHWRWRCFSCGRGQTRDGSRPGDVVDLVTHAEGFPINEGNTGSLRALRHVLRMAGLDHVLDGKVSNTHTRATVPEFSVLVEGEAAPKRQQVKVPLDVALALNRKAREHWQAALAGNDGENARAYLAARGVTDQQIERYAIGFARDKFDDLHKTIDPKHAAFAQALGLTRLYEGPGKPGDAQRNRVVFPYCYPERVNPARPIGVYGFAGRNLTGVDVETGEPIPDFAHYNGKAPQKWNNSKNVDGVWQKAADLVGVWQAMKQARALNRVALCEGAFDMLALDRIGAPALALVGKEVSIGHALAIRSLLRVTQVTYACDGDQAGRSAVVKFAASMTAAGFAPDDLTVIDSDDGRDPATTEPELLRERWANPMPVIDFINSQLGGMTLTLADLRPLLAAAPQVAERFGLANSKQTIVTVADALVVRELTERPELAAFINRNEAAQVLADCPGWAALQDLAFGDTTQPEQLPQDMRRAWLRLWVDHLQRAVQAHKTQPRPADPAALSAYFAHGGRLYKAERVATEQLIAVNGLYR